MEMRLRSSPDGEPLQNRLRYRAGGKSPFSGALLIDLSNSARVTATFERSLQPDLNDLLGEFQ